MSLAPYPEYKESGVEWLGSVPTHWELFPLKRVADFVNGCVFKPDSWSELGTPIIRIENLNGSDKFNYYDGDVPLKHRVAKGDLLFGWSGNRGTSFGPFVWSVPGSFFLNQHIFKVAARTSCEVDWLYWCLRAVTAHVEDQATGIIGMVHVTKGDLGAIKVPLPPHGEQRAHAAFLARETAKIDALIAEQETLLALLAEKRQATISHAVTRGLDPDVPMKDSGIAWLGEVPAHWRVAPLKHLVSFKSGGTPSKERLDYWGGDVPWASAKDLKSETLADTTEHLTHAALAEGAATLLQADTILVVVRGMILARTFPVTRALVPMAVNQDLKGIRPFPGIDTTFLAWLLRGTAEESLQRLDEAGHGTKALRMDSWASMEVPIPPEDEQLEIVSFLDYRTSYLDELSGEARSAIDLLKERRGALIAAAVTGKIDVRGQVEAQAA